MEKPVISDKFTIDDIHKIRKYNAEKRKNLTLKERLEDIKNKANECEKDIKKYKKEGTVI